MTSSSPRPTWSVRTIGFWVGLAGAAGLQLLPRPDGLSSEAWIVASIAVLMAVWWATEALPLAVTALIPIVAFPLFGVMTTRAAGAPFASPIILLLLGGFFIALALERWRLHKRIALHVVVRAGARPRALILGFMVAAALLSMWISNTATCLMLMPIALSVADAEVGEGAQRPFVFALALGVAYACSIGGVATPVGTPTNLIAIENLANQTGVSIGFLQWMGLGLPVVVVMIPLSWWVLTRFAFRVELSQAVTGAAHVREELRGLGPVTGPEWRVAGVFVCVAIAWMARGFVLGPIEAASLAHLASLQAADVSADLIAAAQARAQFVSAMNGSQADAAIAIAGAIAMFILPAGRAAPGARLMDWDTARNIPWNVVLLFGGGLSLAAGMRATGLTEWLGEALPLNDAPAWLLALIFVAVIVFLTELTSNVATVTAFAPVIISVAMTSNADPLAVIAPAAMAGSFAFMLPVATAPNAIVYATGRVPMTVMMRAGLRLNLLAIPVLTLFGALLAPLLG